MTRMIGPDCAVMCNKIINAEMRSLVARGQYVQW